MFSWFRSIPTYNLPKMEGAVEFEDCPISQYKYICPNLSKPNCTDEKCSYFHGPLQYIWFIERNDENGNDAAKDTYLEPYVKPSAQGTSECPVVLFTFEAGKELELNYCKPDIVRHTIKLKNIVMISANFSDMTIKTNAGRRYALKRFSTPPKTLARDYLYATNWLWYWQSDDSNSMWSELKYDRLSPIDAVCPFYSVEKHLENNPSETLFLNVQGAQARFKFTLSIPSMCLTDPYGDEYSVRRRPSTFSSYVEWYYMDDSDRWITFGDLNTKGDHRCQLSSAAIERDFLKKTTTIEYTVRSSRYPYRAARFCDQYVVDLVQNTLTNNKLDTSVPIRRDIFTGDKLVPMEQLPIFWDPMPRCRIFVAINIEKEQDEFKKVERLIRETIPDGNILVLQRMQNPAIYTAYDNYVKVAGSVTSIEEKMLFHGTKDLNIKLICEQNFDPFANIVNGNAYGKGTYFAKNASYSRMYCKTETKSIKLFVCKVAVGPFKNTVTNNLSKMNPLNHLLPQSFNQANIDNFKTSVDNPANPSIFVQAAPHSFYPEYIVEIGFGGLPS